MFPCALNGAARFWMKHCTSPRAFSTPRSRFVLGIETSCDETGAAVLDETGVIRGESLHSQKKTHLDTGGIIPTVAQRLHRENISRVVQEALDRSGIEPSELTAVATTVKPGLALSLGVGLDFSLKFVRLHEKPFIPIHHMEAHALTVKMLHPVDFPFLVLLVSGGHSLLALAKGIDEFLLLGQTLDVAAGDTLDKIARRLSLRNHPECSTLSGGQAIELLAKEGDRLAFHFKAPMGQLYDCNFSFAGLRNQVTMAINKKEREEGVEKGHLLSCVKDIAAASQHTVASHIAKRTHRAILFCKSKGLLPQHNPTLVVSGGVASNEYIRQTLKIVTDATGLHLLCPPTKFCTDNGVMIAWNGIERLKQRKGIMSYTEEVNYEPKAPLGLDITSEVKDATIKLPPLKLRINS
ncbi:tRNA N6-adenosine threonylcarbamoyltransferase, mitochondrial [Sinocyclocheilus grahami]|uniref:N(6)-L-threonylcarbamoyladenine synthase n=1 Tax=Sinocyclocheilus grahami TaxID=75366 RepID=A0A672RRQ2_SINGR|nr:PREDICTED: probable tRNA N6-adenosine threonylcarbamoyltransferase, mitochondrial [Sinocyclocheilus grahami]XP_016150040.1 PREDICTED: probable tRNA N6-adenosine threonylcarbamoyltransferase, mitochondrial [Sinocyclocheilus grahami]